MKQRLDFDEIDKFNSTVINSLDFTKKSEDMFYDTVDLADFQDKDADVIFQYLKSTIRLIPFGDYLKRYIYVKAEMTGAYDEIDIKEYQQTVIDSFAENATPKAFAETTAKLSALAKNWLKQMSVNRSLVFLLGFGLNMCLDDVSEFLMKALRERDFNYKDPTEILYWYCFRKGYKFPKMLKLKQQLMDNAQVSKDIDFSKTGTIKARDIAFEITNDADLLRYLARFKNDNHTNTYSVTANKWFSELYSRCKKIVACFYNADEQERKSNRVWTPSDITEADVERVLCCGMPFNQSGNLERLTASRLSKYFENKRFSRQHIADLLSSAVAIDRFDLITLNFFIFSQDEKYAHDNKNRYIAFTDNTNEILTECMMGELYVANPYESFLLMCILSECPLATYSDVWEMSFEA